MFKSILRYLYTCRLSCERNHTVHEKRIFYNNIIRSYWHIKIPGTFIFVIIQHYTVHCNINLYMRTYDLLISNYTGPVILRHVRPCFVQNNNYNKNKIKNNNNNNHIRFKSYTHIQ